MRYHGGRTHFLYGKVFCAACGAPMTRRTLSGYKGEKYKAWTCKERHKGRTGNGCLMRTIRETDLLAAISLEMNYGRFEAERFLRDVERVEVGMENVAVKSAVQEKFTA